MNSRKITGIVVAVIGAAMLLFSESIARQVAAGREQIRQGQKTVNTLDSTFSQSEYTKPLGNMFTDSAQKKIDAGSLRADQYAALSHQLQIAGIIFIIAGAAIFFIWGRKRG